MKVQHVLILLLALFLCACGDMVAGGGMVSEPVLGKGFTDELSLPPSEEEPSESAPEAPPASAPVSIAPPEKEVFSESGPTAEDRAAPEDESASGGESVGESSAVLSALSSRTGERYAPIAGELHQLINETRVENGLSALTLREDLCSVAVLRAEEAAELWSHTRPDGRDWDTALNEADIVFAAAGENLFAANILDPRAALRGWMESEAHRENLLRASFTSTGLGIIDGGDGYYYYAQIFLTE